MRFIEIKPQQIVFHNSKINPKLARMLNSQTTFSHKCKRLHILIPFLLSYFSLYKFIYLVYIDKVCALKLWVIKSYYFSFKKKTMSQEEVVVSIRDQDLERKELISFSSREVTSVYEKLANMVEERKKKKRFQTLTSVRKIETPKPKIQRVPILLQVQENFKISVLEKNG